MIGRILNVITFQIDEFIATGRVHTLLHTLTKESFSQNCSKSFIVGEFSAQMSGQRNLSLLPRVEYCSLENILSYGICRSLWARALSLTEQTLLHTKDSNVNSWSNPNNIYIIGSLKMWAINFLILKSVYTNQIRILFLKQLDYYSYFVSWTTAVHPIESIRTFRRWIFTAYIVNDTPTAVVETFTPLKYLTAAESYTL